MCGGSKRGCSFYEDLECVFVWRTVFWMKGGLCERETSSVGGQFLCFVSVFAADRRPCWWTDKKREDSKEEKKVYLFV